jgi:hypothetical protein
MKHIVLAALITSFAIGTAMAQSCESRAVSSDGKPLHGACQNELCEKVQEGRLRK